MYPDFLLRLNETTTRSSLGTGEYRKCPKG
jgi:hypothetical protein